jgi:hypothetical protein
MITVHLGFKAFDPHELACHFVARRAGLYAARGLEVRLLDTTFIPDEQLPPRTFHAACTAALHAWLRGAPMKVVFVACDRPMFWLVGRAGALAPEHPGCRIAGYPPGTPPAEMLRMVLETGGDPSHRETVVLPVRDDGARLGLLMGGDVDAAVISSAVPFASIARRGLETLRFFGDVLRVPTTGLAVHSGLLACEPDLVQAMRGCYRESLRLLHADEQLANEALVGCLALEADDAREVVAVLRHCYTPDGCSTTAIESAAIEAVRQALGLSAPPTEPLYVTFHDP